MRMKSSAANLLRRRLNCKAVGLEYAPSGAVYSCEKSGPYATGKEHRLASRRGFCGWFFNVLLLSRSIRRVAQFGRGARQQSQAELQLTREQFRNASLQ